MTACDRDALNEDLDVDDDGYPYDDEENGDDEFDCAGGTMTKRIDPGRLKACVSELAAAINRGECTPRPIELKALAKACEAHGLSQEAARVLQWMGRAAMRPRPA
jgi:hypothetical protein